MIIGTNLDFNNFSKSLVIYYKKLNRELLANYSLQFLDIHLKSTIPSDTIDCLLPLSDCRPNCIRKTTSH